MTLQQFYKAQDEIDMDFEAEKDEATEEVMEDFGEYFETIGLILISKNMLNLAMRYLSKS